MLIVNVNGISVDLIAFDVFERYQKATGGVYDNDIQMLKITSAQYGNLKSIYMWFIMGRSLAVWRNDISSFFTRVHSN